MTKASKSTVPAKGRQQHHQNWQWRVKQHEQEGVDNQHRLTQGTQSWKKMLKGEVNSEFEEWLKRSLVCTSEEPKDLATLSSAIINEYGQCSKICALSNYKFILTYPTEPLMEEALEHHEELDL